MRRFRRRPVIVAGTILIALLLVLFPPWRASAVRTTTRFAAVAGVAPATAIDTIAWGLSFAPLYAPPRAAMSGERMSELAARATRGDTTARSALRAATRDVERRYHVPDALRTDGELWRDSVLAAAGVPATSNYDLAFTVDERWLAARLATLALIALILDLRGGRTLVTHDERDRSH